MALWVPDLFMKRCEQDGEWSLFSPSEAPGLDDVWGEEFEQIYLSNKDKYYLLNRGDKNKLQEKGYRFEPVISQPDYNVARLNLRFLNPTTREKKLDTLILARIYKD